MTAASAGGPTAATLADQLGQMIAVLQAERQSLAEMDIDALMISAIGKQELCDDLQQVAPEGLDQQCEGLLRSARQLNEVNRRVRNLLAVNVTARLDALTGSAGLYRRPAGGKNLGRHRAWPAGLAR